MDVFESPSLRSVDSKSNSLAFQPYYIHLFDSSVNTVTNTFVFSQNQEEKPTSPNTTVYPQWILMDDSIQTIKMKISKAIGESTGVYPNIDAMYLFSRRFIPSNLFDVETMFQELTKNNTVDFTVTSIQTFWIIFQFHIKYKRRI